MKLSVNYLGDFCPIGRFGNPDNFSSPQWLGEIQQVLNKSNLNILNLECPLTISNSPITKSGPNLKANPHTISLLKDMNIDIVCLANNHIMDYGERGLQDTLEILDKAGIKHMGAGTNLQEAKQPLYVEKNGIKIAFINVCETEFSIARKNKAGAAPLDMIENYYTIQEAKQNADHVIMIVHGGVEHYFHPTPRLLKQFRFFASLGVSAIIGHHSHCVQDWEMYQGVPIFYSLGNFVFDEDGNPDGWEKGLLVSHTFTQSKLEKAHYTLFEMDYKSNPIVKTIESDTIQADHILNENEIITAWYKHVSNPKVLRNKINSIQKNALFSRILNKYMPKQLKKRIDVSFLNGLRNESHYEYLIAAIEQYIEEEK